MSQQITRSTVANKTRLKVLSARQELLDSIFESASKKLPEGSKDGKKYEGILRNLVLEGAYALNEKEIIVRGRQKDKETLKKATKGAEKEFKEKTGKDIKIVVDEENWLAEGL